MPYKINIVLTEPLLVRHWFEPNGGGTHFTTPGAGGSAAHLVAEALAKGEPVWAHAFEYASATLGIKHRTTKPKHPWTNGQVERMNRTIKEATVKRFHYDDHDQLAQHLANFISAYNFGRRLKTLKGLTPYEFICKCWTSQPERFGVCQRSCPPISCGVSDFWDAGFAFGVKPDGPGRLPVAGFA